MSFVADVSSGVLDPLPELHLDGYRLRIHVTCASEMDRMTELLDGGTAKGEVDLDSQSEAFLDVPPIATTWMFNRISSKPYWNNQAVQTEAFRGPERSRRGRPYSTF